MTRRTILVLAGVLLVQSIIVALVFTPRPHDGGDNAGYIALAHSLLDRGMYSEIWDYGEPPHTKYPPVFPAIIAFAILLGAKSWAALKLIPAFSTVLAVTFTFLWARDRKGPGLGIIVALLVGLSESVVYYSQWILSDPTFLALTMAALWAFQKESGKAEGRGSGGGDVVWVVVGAALTALAYFTRTAGLPLVLAVLLWLGLHRRWRAFAGVSAVSGIPALLWLVRGSVLGGSDYASEFWFVNPYRPELGTVGVGGLLVRIIENLGGYVTDIIPAGIVGDIYPILLPLGLGLGLVSLVGWIRCLREKVGVAEIFLPAYFGLILLWPPAWSGDRFALPLLPLLFFYSAVALLWLLGALPKNVRVAALAVMTLTFALPAGRQVAAMASEAGSCRELGRVGRGRECLRASLSEYFDLAAWSGENLPDSAIVTTRKPRIFFLMSGVKTQSLPLETDTDEFLSRVREGGSRYITLDNLDGSGYFVYPAVLEHFSSFCGLVKFGESGELGVHVLGLSDTTLGMEPVGEASESLRPCPPEWVRSQPGERIPTTGWTIPLLARDGDEGG